MDKQTWARTLIAGSIAGAGLVVGGVSLASADEPSDGPPCHHGSSPLGADLAKELGVSETKLADAMEAVHGAAQADRRDHLSERLSDAVDSGDLTDADKASVLKAFDMGVLGGPFGGGGRH